MTTPPPTGALLQVLDEIERRHRRDIDSARDWILRVTKGQDGSISAGLQPIPHDGRMGPLLLDVADVADELQVSPATVKRLVRDGALPAVKVARATRIRRADLEAFVAGLEPRGDKAQRSYEEAPAGPITGPAGLRVSPPPGARTGGVEAAAALTHPDPHERSA